MDNLIKDIKALISYVDEKAAINEDERRIRFVISSDKIDRDNEKVEVSAVAAAIPAFSKNPVALACHQHRLQSGKSSVIGNWDTDSFKAKSHTSEMDLIFADTELGREYFKLYKDKHMRAVSLGFRALEWKEERNEKIGRYIIFTKIELYEISGCAVGANREALSKVKGFNLEDEKESLQVQASLDALNKNVKDAFDLLKEAILNELGDLRNDVEELKDLISDPDGFAKSMLGKDLDPPDPADNDKSEQKALEQIATIILNHKESENG